jgi:hypothetical protein
MHQKDSAAAPRLTRRRLLKAAGLTVGAGLAGAAYALRVEPSWTQTVHVRLPVPRLPGAWEGARIVHVSDLHCVPTPLEHLARAMDTVAALKADLVVATGDFITNRLPETREAVAGLFDRLAPPLGVFACLGNHDYGLARPAPRATDLGVAAALSAHGVRVLLNEAVPLVRGGQTLWLAGVEDYWCGRMDPAAAMSRVPARSPAIMLCHNPDAADACAAAGAGAILAGHTHGGQVRLPLIGAILLPVERRDRDQGLRQVDGASLYVNRGLGTVLRVRFLCRPEITVLTPAAAT